HASQRIRSLRQVEPRNAALRGRRVQTTSKAKVLNFMQVTEFRQSVEPRSRAGDAGVPSLQVASHRQEAVAPMLADLFRAHAVEFGQGFRIRGSRCFDGSLRIAVGPANRLRDDAVNDAEFL